MGGIPILVDLDQKHIDYVADEIKEKYEIDAVGTVTDITSPVEVETLKQRVVVDYQRIDILINNAANNPTRSDQRPGMGSESRLENMSIEQWLSDISVGLTGAFLCSRSFGVEMAKAKCGVIVNIGSDLGLIAPDQRLYKKRGLSADKQPVKPVTYSVIKHGLIGLTKQMAFEAAKYNININAVCPSQTLTDMLEESMTKEEMNKLISTIPLKRFAKIKEQVGVILFLASDAASYITGTYIDVNGGQI